MGALHVIRTTLCGWFIPRGWLAPTDCQLMMVSEMRYVLHTHTHQVMRRLREQGELEEIRDDQGPGGEALPDTVRLLTFLFEGGCGKEPAAADGWMITEWNRVLLFVCTQVRAKEAEEGAKRTRKGKGRGGKGLEKEDVAVTAAKAAGKGIAASVDATVEATVVSGD